MRRDIDPIEIKEPPIREFQKKRSCLRLGCLFLGVFFLLVILFASLLFTQLEETQTKEMFDIPPSFPTAIPLYDEKNIDRILITTPRRISPPFRKIASSIVTRFPTIKQVIDPIATPITGNRTTITIEWSDLSATPKFIGEYYSIALVKAGFSILVASETDTLHQLGFDNDTIHGVLYIRNNLKTDDTDVMSLTVIIPTSL